MKPLLRAQFILGLTTLASMLSVGDIALAAHPTVQVETDTTAFGRPIDPNATPSANTPFHLTVALNSGKISAAESYVTAQYNASSPYFHRWLTPDQFGEKFGASATDIGTVVHYLSSNGFANIKVWKNHLFVSAEASRSATETAFAVHIMGCRRSDAEIGSGNTSPFYAPDRAPSVDESVAPVISGVYGLSNIASRRSYITHAPDTGGTSSATPLNPSNLSDIYDLTPLHNKGLLGDGVKVDIFSPTTYMASDVTKFLTFNKITEANITVVPVNGGATDNTDQDEACLDIEEIVGQAPASTIKVFEGPNDGSFDIYNAMAEDDPTIVSESYGLAENQETATYAQQYEAIRLQMAAEGISIFVASGDNGAYDDINQATISASVDATSAYVTAVGGSELNQGSDIDSWDGEIAWTYNDGTLDPNTGSGGGLSIYIQRPSWQTGPGVANVSSDGYRQIPDVAILGSTPYYNIYTKGSWEAVGGTSAGCAFYAGAMAVVTQALGTHVGNMDSLLYGYGANDKAVYHDITSGNNGVYTCTPGWDFVTGWGSSDFNLLTTALENSDLNISNETPAHHFGPGLQMFGVPYTYPNNATTATVLSGLVTTSGASTNAIAAWLPLSQTYALTPTAPSNLPVPGQGYWGRFSTSAGGTVVSEGIPVAASTFSIPISPGWNMISDPYVVSVPIDSIEVLNGNSTTTFQQALTKGEIAPDFYNYNGSDYVDYGPGDSVNSYSGYWINSFVTGSLIFSRP